MYGDLTRNEIIEWCERNHLDHSITPSGAMVAIWGDGREVYFHPDGAIELRKFAVIGGQEPEDDVQLNGKQIEVTTYDGGSYRLSGAMFPIDR